MHDCQVENAPKMLDWIRTRGGVAVWTSLDLSDPGFSMSTPALTTEGQPYAKPHWKLANAPAQVITDPAQIRVITAKEVKRFHVGVRMGAQGLKLKVTDGGTRRIRAAVAKAGDDAWYEFDYGTQEAVIYVPGDAVLLSDWAKL